MDTIDKLYQKGVSRRNFLVSAGAAGTVAALAGCSNGGTIASPTALTLTDTDILTFALNLEYLEAEYYLYAATGSGLTPTDAGTGAGITLVPAVTKVPTQSVAQQNIINEIAYDEQSHVQYLRKTIGSGVISRPAIDLTFFAALGAAANAQLATTPPPAAAGQTAAQTLATYTTIPTGFTPFASFDAFVVGAFIFEDVGVTAYNGAGPFISLAGRTNGILAAASGVLAVEAYHAAYVRTYLTANAIAGQTPNTQTTSYAPFGYAKTVQNLRAALSGGQGETQLLLPQYTVAGVPTSVTSTIVNANASALAYSRTTDQVLHIVYGSPTVGASKGGFFPNGTTFKFSTTTS